MQSCIRAHATVGCRSVPMLGRVRGATAQARVLRVHYRRTERHTEKPRRCRCRYLIAERPKYCAPAHNARVQEQEDGNRQRGHFPASARGDETPRRSSAANYSHKPSCQVCQVYSLSSCRHHHPFREVVQQSPAVAVPRVSRQRFKLPSSPRAL